MEKRVPPKRYRSTCIEKTLVSAKVFRGVFKLEEPNTIEFKSGQTMMLYVAPGQNRAMSIASAPHETDRLTILYDISPQGVGSKWMEALKVGDEVQFMAPLGIFTFKPSPHKKVFVATGTGIAPFRAMTLEHYTHGGTDDITIYWGLRFENDIFLTDEFDAITREHPQFHYTITLSQAGDAWQGKRGRVTDHVTQECVDLPNTDFYLCGNGSMIRDIHAQLIANGVPEGQIFHELYFSK